MGCTNWFKASSPPPVTYRLPDEDENLKGNLGSVIKGEAVIWILDRHSTTSIIPEKWSALRIKEREKLK